MKQKLYTFRGKIRRKNYAHETLLLRICFDKLIAPHCTRTPLKQNELSLVRRVVNNASSVRPSYRDTVREQQTVTVNTFNALQSF